MLPSDGRGKQVRGGGVLNCRKYGCMAYTSNEAPCFDALFCVLVSPPCAPASFWARRLRRTCPPSDALFLPPPPSPLSAPLCTSLFLGEAFASDLSAIFPRLRVVAISSNKVSDESSLIAEMSHH